MNESFIKSAQQKGFVEGVKAERARVAAAVAAAIEEEGAAHEKPLKQVLRFVEYGYRTRPRFPAGLDVGDDAKSALLRRLDELGIPQGTGVEALIDAFAAVVEKQDRLMKRAFRSLAEASYSKPEDVEAAVERMMAATKEPI